MSRWPVSTGASLGSWMIRSHADASVMSSFTLRSARPTLGVRDVAASVAWYERVLGATCEITMGEPPALAPPTTHPWGRRDFVLIDPEGHQLALGEHVDEVGTNRHRCGARNAVTAARYASRWSI